MEHSSVLLALNRTEQLQQLVIFPDLVGAWALPLDPVRTDLPALDQERETVDLMAILATGQLPLFSLD